MTSWGEMVSTLKGDEVVIKVSSTVDSIRSSDLKTVNIASFDDKTEGVYFLSLKNKVRVWVIWKKKRGKQK